MRTGTEVSWVLDGRTPDQLPMARLAEYMAELATMFGETGHVHFARVEKGSTRLVAKIDVGKPAQRVQSRIYAVRDRRAPREAMTAFRKIDEMVAADGGRARLQFGTANVLRFTGSGNALPEEAVTMHDDGTITGQLYAMSEDRTGMVHARIRPRQDKSYIACTADIAVGRELRNYLFESVRVQGRGRWVRSPQSAWTCHSLHVRSVWRVKDAPLREAVDALRKLEANWPDDPLSDWEKLDERDGAA